MVKSLREMVECLYVVIENVLMDISEAKIWYRNFLIFLNESVIRIAKQTSSTGTPEIENCKNHLAKLFSNKEVLLKLFCSKESFYMANIAAHFDIKSDESLKNKASLFHFVQDSATGIIYQKTLNAGETKGSWTKSQLPLPHPTEFNTEYKPVSGLKTIMGNIKHAFECLYCNPMKVLSQYVSIEGAYPFSGNANTKLKVCDVAPVYSSANIQYCLLVHYSAIPAAPNSKGEENIGIIAKVKASTKWICSFKKFPAGVTLTEGKFHGTKDIVCLLSSQGKDVLAAFSLAEFKLDESCAFEVTKFDEMLRLPCEEAAITRFLELSEGKKEKLRCGCRGYICLVGDERRLEVYEISEA